MPTPPPNGPAHTRAISREVGKRLRPVFAEQPAPSHDCAPTRTDENSPLIAPEQDRNSSPPVSAKPAKHSGSCHRWQFTCCEFGALAIPPPAILLTRRLGRGTTTILPRQ